MGVYQFIVGPHVLSTRPKAPSAVHCVPTWPYFSLAFAPLNYAGFLQQCSVRALSYTPHGIPASPNSNRPLSHNTDEIHHQHVFLLRNMSFPLINGNHLRAPSLPGSTKREKNAVWDRHSRTPPCRPPSRDQNTEFRGIQFIPTQTHNEPENTRN